MSLRPRITPPRDLVPLPVLIGVGAVLALGLFLTLEARQTAPAPTSAPPIPAPVPDLTIPPAPTPATPTQIVIHTDAPPARQTAAPQIAPPPLPMALRLPPPSFTAPPPIAPRPATEPDRTPALVLDFTPGTGPATKPDSAGDDTVQATLIHNRASVIAQGTLISAILETPLDSDRPGIARALVAADVRGFDGTRILIPRGSRLIGSFKAEASPALHRVLVTWDRLIRPDGVAIRLASPGTDALGGAGLPGAVNTHFAERFTSAVLQSALMVGVNVASELASPASGTFIGLPAQGTQLGQQLVPNTARPPTIKVRGGSQIAILVAHDLDFAGTPAVR